MMPSTSSCALVFLTLLGSISISHGQTDEKAQLARLMFAAFQCGTYAAMSDNEKEKARLFEVGVKAGREFLNSVNQGQITEAGEVPEAVMTLLSYTAYNLASDIELAELGGKTKPGRIPKKVEGPSNDFVLGRIFEFSTSSAYKIARVAEKSVYAPEGVTDQAHTKENAIEKYRTRNCWLVK